MGREVRHGDLSGRPPPRATFAPMNAVRVKSELDTIEAALADIRAGKVVIVVDDEDRENEGDFITAARNVTPEVINFMSKHGRGLICAALTEERCSELDLDLMVTRNTDPHRTAFTISVDLIGQGNTTGISAHDRARTVQALIDPATSPGALGRPGHIFPLKARNGGVLRRTGHTEATVDLARLAGFEPAGVLVEIMNDDGSMARLPQLMEIAAQFGLRIISIKDLIAYRLQQESLVEMLDSIPFETRYGQFRLVAFRDQIQEVEHLALIRGEWSEDEVIPVRVHSRNVIRDLFGTLHPDTEPSINRAIRYISEYGKGAVVYMNHLRDNHSLLADFDALRKTGQTRQAGASMDARDYGIGAQILRQLGIRKMNLLTNHPTRRTGIIGYGLEITDNTSF
jgi:3,4-dihydroxy 2-butanone 4-phosphate synthase / GTP cyclohydrolase II